MLLKLRADYKQAQGGRFSLRTFHDTVLGHGGLRYRCSARRSSVPTRVAFSTSMDQTPCPFTSTSARPTAVGSRSSRSSPTRLTICPTCGGPVRGLLSSPAIQFKGSGWYITDYARKRDRGRKERGRRPHDRRQEPRPGRKLLRLVELDQCGSKPRAAATPRRPRKTRPASSAGGDSHLAPAAPPRLLFGGPTLRQVRPEGLYEVLSLQRELDHRLQESELVAGVVADAINLVGVERPALQQRAQTVGQLNLAGRVALGRRERLEDVGRQDVAADDGEVGGRLFASAASPPGP